MSPSEGRVVMLNSSSMLSQRVICWASSKDKIAVLLVLAVFMNTANWSCIPLSGMLEIEDNKTVVILEK